VKKVVPFTRARETSLYGSKAVGLGDAARQGLPVPPGVALSGNLVEAVASGEDKAIEKVAKAIAALPPPFAVRSSAVDEDGAAASFAGQHLTVLNVHSVADVPGAVREVWWSANSDSAITYRQRVGLFTRPSVGVVVQTLLNPTVAGVMFTENPVTGADERLIEASWGLGEAVVAGLVVPDHFRLDRSGRVLERKVGRKRIAIRSLPNGGTFEQQVPPAQVNQLCLDDAQLAALGELALQCEKVYGPRRDIEWAFQEGTLYLLQCRAVTTGKARSEAPPPGPPPRDPVAALQRVQLFADMDRRQAEQIARLLKERPFAKGETVIMEGSGGSRLLPHRLRGGHGLEKRRPPRHPRPGRLLRRDRPDRRRPPLGHGDRCDRPGLLRAHVLGVPPAGRRQRRHRMEAPAGASEAVARRRPELAPDLQPRRRNDRQARTERGGGASPALRRSRSRRRTRVEDVDVNGDIKRRILDPRPHALHDLGEPLALEVHGGDTEAEALVVQPSPPRREASPRTGIDGSGSTPSPDTSTPWPGRRSARGRFWPDGPSARKRSGSPRRLSRSCTSPWVRRMRRYFGSGKRDGSRIPGSFW